MYQIISNSPAKPLQDKRIETSPVSTIEEARLDLELEHKRQAESGSDVSEILHDEFERMDSSNEVERVFLIEEI